MGSVRTWWSSGFEQQPGSSPFMKLATLRLAALGAEPSALGSASKATLTFHAGFLVRARKETVSQFVEFAQLSGTALMDAKGQPSFVCEASAAIKHSAEPKDATSPRLGLPLLFDEHFVSPPGPGTPQALLVLPELTAGANFAEVVAVLSINDAVESSLETSSTLDIPLRPWLARLTRLRLFDHTGKILANTAYEVDGPLQQLKSETDESGFTRELSLDELQPTTVSVGETEYLVVRRKDDEPISRAKSILNALGYEAGPVAPDDTRQFQQALARFQREESLTITKALNSETTARLENRAQ